MEGTHAGAVCEELHPVGRTHVAEVHRGLSPMMRDPMLEQGKSVRSPAPEEDEAAETTCDGLIVTAISHPPALL